MNAVATVIVLALMGQTAQAAPEAAPTEGFLEYLATFEPDDEATIVDFALDAEEEAREPMRPEDSPKEEDDDSA
jgi:hypothetical protein